jgi:putative addiction module killer protein
MLQICVMISIQTTDTFNAWLASLKDRQVAARIQARIDRAEDGNFGDCSPVGEGVSEMRITVGRAIECISSSAALK